MSSTPTVAGPPVTFEIVARFDSLRKRYVASWMLRELAICLTILSFAWICLGIGDYFGEWPLIVRRINALVVVATMVACFSYRGSRLRSLTQRSQFAALLEGRFNDFGQRLRTVLEVSEGHVRGPQEMLNALGHQTLGRWETVVPGQIVPQRQMLFALATAVIALLAVVSLMNLGQWRTAMWRAVGNDQSYTRLEVTPQNARVIEGEQIVVGLSLHGRTNRDVTLHYRMANANDAKDNDWTEVDLLPRESESPEHETQSVDLPIPSLTTATFAAELGKATEAIEYRFMTSAGSTKTYRIDVEPLIDAIDIRAVVKSPAYTKLEPREFQGTDVSALRGSDLEVTIVTNHPLVKARLLIGTKSSQLEAQALPQSEATTQWSFNLPTSTSIRWRFEGEGEGSIPLTPVNGRLRVRADEPPKINWRGPADEIQVHALTELPMEVSISDDFGLVEAGIVFELGDEDEFALTQWSADEERAEKGSADERTVELKLSELLPLESFGLTDRDFVAYYAYALDNRDGSPSRSESDVRYIDIRPLRQYYAEREAGPGGGLGGGFSTSVGEIIQRQRFLMNKSRKLVRSSTDLGEQLGTIDGLVAAQSELAGLARFLIDRLAALGRDENEALAVAETAMLQAADSLAVGSFVLALKQQEEAMRALVEARDSLREITLGQMSAQQRQALSQLLQQLNQRLRRTPAASDRALADSIQKLAEEQLALGASVGTILRDRTSAKTNTADANSAEQGLQPDSETQEGEANVDERLDNALDEQLALLARLQDIGDSLSEEVLESELVSQRLASSLAAMGELVDQLQNEMLDNFEPTTRGHGLNLRELAVLIESLSQSEAVDRIPSIAELTASLAAMEQDLSSALAPPASSNATEASGNPTEPVNDLSELAARLTARSQTVHEALKWATNSTEGTASQVSESIADFLKENRLLETLQASDAFAERIAQEATNDRGGSNAATPEQSHAARERAADYSDGALQLEAIYRQLVTPLLARLREIEAQATNLQQKLVEETESSGETDVELRELELAIKATGLEDIAEVLLSGDPTDGEGNSGVSQRVGAAVNLLRERIQQLILRDIATDRDAIVPPQYRQLVDRYFQVISGATNNADNADNADIAESNP